MTWTVRNFSFSDNLLIIRPDHDHDIEEVACSSDEGNGPERLQVPIPGRAVVTFSPSPLLSLRPVRLSVELVRMKPNTEVTRVSQDFAGVQGVAWSTG